MNAELKSIEIVLKTLGTARMSELSECLCFYLSDSLTGYVELCTYLLERARSAVLKAEAELKNMLFSGSECVQDFVQLFLEKSV